MKDKEHLYIKSCHLRSWEMKDIKTDQKKLKNNFEIYQIKFLKKKLN